LGEPDPFRFKHREALREVVANVVRNQLDRKAALAFLASWAGNNITAEEGGRFREMAETELLGLHEGNFARYQIRPAEFAAWQEIWDNRTKH
jgi:hypothetical protein